VYRIKTLKKQQRSNKKAVEPWIYRVTINDSYVFNIYSVLKTNESFIVTLYIENMQITVTYLIELFFLYKNTADIRIVTLQTDIRKKGPTLPNDSVYLDCDSAR
jgi:hypothetical protein